MLLNTEFDPAVASTLGFGLPMYPFPPGPPPPTVIVYVVPAVTLNPVPVL
jgi:hypothetical protein